MILGLGAVGLALLAALPQFAEEYTIAFMLSMLAYTVMASAWSIFSGATRYISLATSAFFGIGAYCLAYWGEALPLPVVVLIAAAFGFLIALVVGLSTLRLSGVYFVVFTFGLTELIRQVMIWFEINQTRTLVRQVYLDVTTTELYYYLLGLVILVFLAGYLVGRSRLGLALRAIGEDETAARHSGIDTTLVKVLVFALSSAFMSATGALLMPRWTYVDPNIAFNPLISFQVLIMALLGGVHRLYGPALGVIPLVLLFEFLVTRFPYQFNVVLGAIFILIVYFLPNGVTGLLEQTAARLPYLRIRRPPARADRSSGGRPKP
jgi:branched-chain amino acid transport system permease protein